MCITNIIVKGIFIIVMAEEKGCRGIYISAPVLRSLRKCSHRKFYLKDAWESGRKNIPGTNTSGFQGNEGNLSVSECAVEERAHGKRVAWWLGSCSDEVGKGPGDFYGVFCKLGWVLVILLL